MNLRELQRLAGEVFWQWGVRCLGVSLLPLLLEALVMVFSRHWPANFVEFMLWPSVPAVGVISCATIALDILNMRSRKLFQLDQKRKLTYRLKKYIDKLDNFKRWAFLFLALATVEAMVYVILLMINNYNFIIQSKIVAVTNLVAIILVVTFCLGAKCYMTTLEPKPKGLGR